MEPRRGLSIQVVEPALNVLVDPLDLDGAEGALPGLDGVLDLGVAEPIVVVLLVGRGIQPRRHVYTSGHEGATAVCSEKGNLV